MTEEEIQLRIMTMGSVFINAKIGEEVDPKNINYKDSVKN